MLAGVFRQLMMAFHSVRSPVSLHIECIEVGLSMLMYAYLSRMQSVV